MLYRYEDILFCSTSNFVVTLYPILFTVWIHASYVCKHVGQCPAKSGLWGYNFITIKIARCTKQHIFATVLLFLFKFRTLVPTPFLCVKIDFCDLDLFRAVDTTIVNPAS